MNAEIICIGDELLIGQVINTNAARIAEQLNLSGVKVAYSSVLPDDETAILEALHAADVRSDLIIITGGLGPTKDDITKKTLCDFFQSKLILNETVLSDVVEIFARKGRVLTDINKKQAEVPENCDVIRNFNGTAPGMWFNKNGKIFVSIPGVPYEAMAMVENYIIPKIKAEYKLPAIFHMTVHTQGIGESYLAEILEDWENSLSVEGIKLAYLPAPGIVRLRLSGYGENFSDVKEKVIKKRDQLLPLITEYFVAIEEYGEKQPLIQELLGEALRNNGKKIALAESCTGGYMAHLITSIPGSSAYFNGCIVPYQNEFKQQLLGVHGEVFSSSGAVSEDCVKQMAKSTIIKFNVDYSIAVSGIAGPSGGTKEKPVGTVWIAWANKNDVVAERFVFSHDRGRNIHITAITALEKLRKLILSGF